MSVPAAATPPVAPEGGGFGGAFLKTGKFKRAGREKIRSAGFANVADFLDYTGLNQDTATKDTLASGLAAGKKPVVAPTVEPAPTAPAQVQGPTITEGLVGQGVDLANEGKNILKSRPDLINQSNDSFSNAFQQSQGAANPQLSQMLQGLLDQQNQGAQADIKNYFSTAPLDQARSKLAQLNVDNQQAGLTGSRSSNQIGADIQRKLISDQAGALLGANQQSRQNVLDQLTQTRGANVNLAGLFSGQGVQQGNLANQAAQTGAGIANQGFQNQVGGIETGSKLSQQDFNNALQSLITGNQISQQTLQNIQANKANQFSQEQAMKLFDLLKNSPGGSGILQTLLGAAGGIGGAFVGGPAGAVAGAGVGSAAGSAIG